jgi:hypothetical protein
MIALMAAMAGANGFAMMAGLAAAHAERLRKVPSIDPKKGKMPIGGTFKNIFKGLDTDATFSSLSALFSQALHGLAAARHAADREKARKRRVVCIDGKFSGKSGSKFRKTAKVRMPALSIQRPDRFRRRSRSTRKRTRQPMRPGFWT